MGKSLRQLLAEEKPEVAAAARVQADEILLNIHLAELREKVKKTQVEMAQALGIKQPTVAGMEKPGRDVKLSTLRRYVDAIGGKLNIDVELPDGIICSGSDTGYCG
ncbi:TPA: helix-turn-helix domain-containing protein [Morganella morganii]